MKMTLTFENLGGWKVVITEGTCKEQYKLMANYEPEAANVTHLRQYGYGGIIHINTAWNTSSRVNGYGPFGEKSLNGENKTNFFRCCCRVFAWC